MKGGEHMKTVVTFFIIAFALLTFIGTAVAKEITGEVTAVDTMKGTLTLKSGTVEAPFDCETGSLIKDVKVGDHVTVQYKEAGGKKIATKVTAKKKKAAAGAAVAKEMTGEVTAVDTMKGTLTLKSGTVEAPFDCETGSLIKDVKVGDHVTVQYKEADGKKIATKVTAKKKKKATGGQ